MPIGCPEKQPMGALVGNRDGPIPGNDASQNRSALHLLAGPVTIGTMAQPLPLNVVNLEVDGSGVGTMIIRVATMREYNTAVAYLDSEGTLQDLSGRVRRIRLDGPPARPSKLPGEVALAIVEESPPPEAVTERMALGNNFLQASCWVRVISFTPPTEEGGEGALRVHCDTKAEYQEIRRFVDEEHGSALRLLDGGHWYVHRIDDDGRPNRPFPQNVSIRLAWLYLG